MSTIVSPMPLDLSSCDREPVHIPGAIQPHGAVLVLDPRDLRITGVSENVERFLGVAPAALLGRTLAPQTTIHQAAELERLLREPDGEERNPLELVRQSGERFDAFVHHHDGRVLLEIEPESSDPTFPQASVHNRVRRSIARLRETSSLRELCERAANEVRLLTSFDRVIVYAFLPDGTGEVVAESCATGDPTYLGLRFPASDIPRQARALYASCRLRAIPTSSYVPTRLLGSDEDRPVDLTHAVLRSISPVHLEYMRNMGVTASLGLSLMNDDQLWGLITCNHESGPRFVPYRARAACALVGEIISSLIGPKERLQAAERRGAFLDMQAKLLQFVAQDRDLAQGLTSHTPSLIEVTRSPGAALFHDGVLHLVGQTPPPAAVTGLLAWLEAQPTASLVLQSLPAEHAPALAWKDTGCGLIARRVPSRDRRLVSQDSWLLWFRPEVAQTVSWGGDPKKPVATSASSTKMSPRTSFQLWKEDVHLNSAPFQPEEVAAAYGLADALADVILDIAVSRKIAGDAALLEESHRKLVQQIEENQKVELELRRAQKLEAVGRLAAGIAHEINTPLQFTADSLEFLRQATGELVSLVASHAEAVGRVALDAADFDYLSERLPPALARAAEGLGRVSRIVTAMKQFAHIDGVDKSPADINEGIASSLEIARGEIKGLADVHVELGELPWIPCYLGDLNQVILCLLLNAVHAIESTLGATRARGTITVRSWCAGPDVFVTVADDGCGIEPSLRESIFLPFFTTREVGRGTGQGLAIAHAIVVGKHGGSISVESEVGRGSTFTVRLPVEPPPA